MVRLWEADLRHTCNRLFLPCNDKGKEAMIVCPQQPVWLRTYYQIQKTNQLFNILCFERSCIFLFRQMWKMKIWIELLSWLISVSSVCLWLTKSKNPHCLGTTTPPPTTATTMLNNLSVLYANWTLANWCCTMLKIHYDIHLEVRGTSVLKPSSNWIPLHYWRIHQKFKQFDPTSGSTSTAAASTQQLLFFSSSFPP